MRVAVKRAGAFEAGDREHVRVDGREVTVLNHEGEYYALLNQCPHDCGPVGEGLVRGKVVAEAADPGDRTREAFDEETPTITCPWHGWSFEMETGTHVGTDEVRLPTFDVVVEDGTVYVEA